MSLHMKVDTNIELARAGKSEGLWSEADVLLHKFLSTKKVLVLGKDIEQPLKTGDTFCNLVI